MSTSAGYSAKVRLSLHVGEQIVCLSHVGPNVLIPTGHFTPIHKMETGRLVIAVDDVEDSRDICLPDGVSEPDLRCAWE